MIVSVRNLFRCLADSLLHEQIPAETVAPVHLGVVGALLLALVAHWPALGRVYLFDDQDAIAENPALAAPESFRWLHRMPPNSTFTARPVLSWSFGLNALILGHRPSSDHMGNLLIHLGNALLPIG